MLRIQFFNRLPQPWPNDGPIKYFSRLEFHDYTPLMIRCSTMGPSDHDGKKVRAPTIMTIQAKNTTNRGVCVGNVPALSGTDFFFRNEPAMAMTGMIVPYR